MTALVDYGVGRYVSGQADILILPPNWKANSNIPLCVFLHGDLGSALTFAQWPAVNFPFLLAERYGIPCLSIDADGAPATAKSSWANDASQTNTMTSITGAQTKIGCKTGNGSALIFATSMGTALGWTLIRNNRATFRAAVMTLVVASTQALYDTNPTQKAQIDQAYSNVAGGWPAARNTHDISIFAPELAGFPIWIGETTDDLATPANVTALMNGIGGTAVEAHYFGTGGHDITKIPPDPPAAYLAVNSGLS